MSKQRRRILWLAALGCVIGLIANLSRTERNHPEQRAGLPLTLVADVQTQSEAESDFQNKIVPVFEQYCYECHGDGQNTAGLAIDSFKTADSIAQDPATWELLQRYVHTHEMPPRGQPQPTAAQRDLVSSWIDRRLCDYYTKHLDPGRVTIHRLNRAEYNNTIADLTGVTFRPADDFPADDSGYGFDNVGDVLSLPPMLMEKYMAAADKIMDEAIVTDPIQQTVQHIPASLAEVGFNAFGDRGDGWVKLVSLEEDDVAVEIPVPAAGDYLMRVKAYATRDGGVGAYDPHSPFNPRGGLAAFKKSVYDGPTRMSILLNDADIQDFQVTTDEKHPGVYEARIGVPAGMQRFRASVRRVRGGEGELLMKNGRLGKEQTGVVYVKYIEIQGPLPCGTRRYPAAELPLVGQGTTLPNGACLFTGQGESSVTIDAPEDGDYLLRAQAYAMQAGKQTAQMQFRLDGRAVGAFDCLAPGKMKPLHGQRVFSLALLVPVPQVYEIRARLTAGKHRFAAAFLNPFSDPKNPNVNLRQRSLTLQYLEVADLSSPVLIPPIPQPLRQIFMRYVNLDDPATQTRTAARSIICDFAFRAWRRPPAAGELDRLMSLYDLAGSQGDGFLASVKLAFKAVLVSPHFLFRGELQPEPDNPDSVHPIDDFALASRLSYFLWSTTPDQELLDLASRGRLRQNLEFQVRRMLASPKAEALVDNFGGQWLQFRSLDTVAPDKTIFLTYDAALRQSMQIETELFFQYVLRQDRSVMDFVDGDYTFVNGPLAALYGIPNVSGDEFRRVSLVGTPRRGVLTQASVLTLTSNPNRTSPVKRGKWVLENILGTPPPPPPPEVPSLDAEGKTIIGSLRHQMEVHRTNPVCASCHARMDPIGFAFENFDGIGQWRDIDSDFPIDSSGTLLTGEAIKGPMDLIAVLAKSHRDDFLHCLAEKMLTYALGRGPQVYDHAALDQIVSRMLNNDCRFSSLIMAVVDSAPFQLRRGEGTTVTAAN